VVLHSGGVRGFRSFVSYSTETGTGFAIVMNAQTRTIDRLAATFWDRALRESDTAQAR